ncbi:MAG: hypothetical protein ACLP7Q_02185 [Isosphaeraceae bacterium]
MTRFDKLLYHINKDNMGIEIGPSHNPVAPKKNGYRVHIIDHATQTELIEKYRTHNLNVENIEEVDFVWKGESYVQLTGRHKYYDWIIASHMVEHSPDLIGFLNECDSILKEEGVLSLAIPDKRFCFDHFRPLSGIAKVIDSHIGKQKTHSPGTAAEHILNAVNRDGKIAWSDRYQGQYHLHHKSLDECVQMMDRTARGEYVDFHAWCFTPSSFRLLIHDLNLLGLVSLQEVAFFPTEAFEFYVTLGHPKERIRFDRLAMLKMVESELALAS